MHSSSAIGGMASITRVDGDSVRRRFRGDRLRTSEAGEGAGGLEGYVGVEIAEQIDERGDNVGAGAREPACVGTDRGFGVA